MKTLIMQKIAGILVVFVALSLFAGKDPSEEGILRKFIGRIKRTILDNKLTLFLICAFFIAFSHINIASGSMEPTLMTGEKGFALDTVFGYRPHRGDIVCFSVEDEIWIKRVIGLPGDVVQIDDGLVYINGELLNEDYLQPGLYTDYGKQMQYVVPDGHIFVMGDNRNHSFDSRYWEDPYVDTSRVIGKYMGTLFHK